MRFGIFLACLGTAVGTTAPAADSPRPNILFILAEDIGPDLACYGTPLVSTPHLDRLAARGVRYARALLTDAQSRGVRAPRPQWHQRVVSYIASGD